MDIHRQLRRIDIPEQIAGKLGKTLLATHVFSWFLAAKIAIISEPAKKKARKIILASAKIFIHNLIFPAKNPLGLSRAGGEEANLKKVHSYLINI